MKTTVIIQARVGSTRLPRKVLMELAGRTVLSHVIQRIQRCRQVNQVVVATTEKEDDDDVAKEAERNDALAVRGSETDVLDRYHQAASQVGATEILRITADCPLIDPRVVDAIITRFHQQRHIDKPLDYLSNVHPRTFPHGLDTEMFCFKALQTAHREATEPYEREHVTPFLYLNANRFRLGNYRQPVDQSELRWTLDEPADLMFLQTVFGHFGNKAYVRTEEVIQLLKQNPELSRINAHVEQKKLKAA